LATKFETQRIQIVDDKNVAHQIELPTSALRLLLEILIELATGNAVRVVPVHAELTTQEAADLLNVSRPRLIKLLESHALPYHKTGKHRRVRFDDLMNFKAKRDQERERARHEFKHQKRHAASTFSQRALDFFRRTEASVNALATVLRVPTLRVNDVVLERVRVGGGNSSRLVHHFGDNGIPRPSRQAGYTYTSPRLAKGNRARG